MAARWRPLPRRARSTRRVAVALGLVTALSLPVPAEAWTAAASGSGKVQATTISPIDTLTAECKPGLLGLGTSIDVVWTDTPPAWVDGYEIRWGTSPGPPYSKPAQNVGAATRTWNTGDLSAATYYFRVRAKGANWRSTDFERSARVKPGFLGLGTTC